MYSSSNELLSHWSRKINIGPSDYPTEFRLVSIPLGNAPQFANTGASSSHFDISSIHRGQSGFHPQVEFVPNFHHVAAIRSRKEHHHKSTPIEIESLHAGNTFEGMRSVDMTATSVDMTAGLGWNRLNSPKRIPASPPCERHPYLPPILFTLGQKVLAKYHGGSEWRKAKVSNIIERQSGATWFDVTFVIRSEVERGLPSYYLKPDPEAWALRSGDKIHARYRGRASWHPAKIVCLSHYQPWVMQGITSVDSRADVASITSPERSYDDAVTATSGETRPLHGLGTDVVQLSQDYLLFDDHRKHHLCSGGITIEDESMLPEAYDPDLLCYDIKYAGGRTELCVPRHLIRFDEGTRDKEQPASSDGRMTASAMHEELGFVLRQRTNTARHNTPSSQLVLEVPQVEKKQENEEEDDLSLNTIGLQEATMTAAETAEQFIGLPISNHGHQPMQNTCAVTSSTQVVDHVENQSYNSQDKMSHSTISNRIELGTALGKESRRDEGRKGTPNSSRLHHISHVPSSSVDPLDSLTVHVKQQEVSGPPRTTLATDYTPSRLSMQEKMSQQGHDRNILKFNARRAYPDGVTIPTTRSLQNRPRSKDADFVRGISASHSHDVSDDASLGGWSGGTGFGASVGSFNFTTMTSPIEKPLKASISMTTKKKRTKSASSSRNKSKTTALSLPGRESSDGIQYSVFNEKEEFEDLVGSLTVKDHPISSRAKP